MLLSLNCWPFQPLSQQLQWLELWQKCSHSRLALTWHLAVCHPCFRWVWKTGEVTHSHSHLFSPSLPRFLPASPCADKSYQERVNIGLRSLPIIQRRCVCWEVNAQLSFIMQIWSFNARSVRHVVGHCSQLQENSSLTASSACLHGDAEIKIISRDIIFTICTFLQSITMRNLNNRFQ